MWGFFGLGSDYKAHLYDQLFDLMYYGKMGWSWTELYSLPTHVRNYYYRKLADVREKENNTEKAEADKIRSAATRRR